MTLTEFSKIFYDTSVILLKNTRENLPGLRLTDDKANQISEIISKFARIKTFTHFNNEVLSKSNTEQLIQIYTRLESDEDFASQLRLFCSSYHSYKPSDSNTVCGSVLSDYTVAHNEIKCILKQSWYNETNVPVSRELVDLSGNVIWKSNGEDDTIDLSNVKELLRRETDNEDVKISIPPEQLKIIKDALVFRQDGLDPNSDNQNEMHLHFDLFTLIAFMEHSVTVTLTKEQVKRFGFKYGVDLNLDWVV